MKRFFTYFLLLSLAIGGVVWLGLWLVERQHYETTDDAYLKANMLLISPKVEGYVTQLAIADNQFVNKGQLLLAIDNRDYQAKVAQAEASIEAEMAYGQRLLAMKAAQQANINAAEAQVNAAQANLDPFTKDLHRFTTLVSRGAAPVQMLDNLKAQSKQATAQLQGQQSTLNAQQHQLTTFDVEMTEVEARLKRAKAQLVLAKMDLEYTQIHAPVAGIIGNRGVQLGQLVRPGMNLAYLVDNQSVWVEANFKETQLTLMRPGQPVTIHLDSYPDTVFEGTVESLSPASGSEFSLLPPENATGNFTKIVRRVPVKIVFKQGTDLSLLKTGLSAEVEVKVK